jgi:hypothetical protein
VKDYLRHPNGRGKLYGDCAVSRSSYVSRDSVVKDSAVVRDARLEGACVVEGNTILLGGYFKDCYVGPGPSGGASPFIASGNFEGCTITNGVQIAGKPDALNSVLACKRISGTPTFDGCTLLGKSEVFDSPALVGVTLKDCAWIYGDCVLFGNFTVGGLSRIERGYWSCAPRSMDFQNFSVTESKGGVMVDCRYRTFEDWKANGRRFAKRREFIVGELSDELIENVLALFSEWEAEQGVTV